MHFSGFQDPWFRITIPTWRSTGQRADTGSPMKTSKHAIANAMVIEDQDDGTRLHLGASIAGALLEVVTIVRDDGTGLAIHAMPMRSKYRRLLPGEG